MEKLKLKSFFNLGNFEKKSKGSSKLCYGSSGFGRVAGCSDHYKIEGKFQF
jgi:hypothetical protein